MPTLGDFSLVQYEDGVLTVNLAPPAPISGKTIVWTLQKRFGHTDNPIAVCSCSSGFNNVSGINVIDGLQGVFQVNVIRVTSGLDPGNYANSARCTDSGSYASYTQGYLQLGVGIQ